MKKNICRIIVTCAFKTGFFNLNIELTYFITILLKILPFFKAKL